MKSLLGNKLRKKKAVSKGGKELGDVKDAYFEVNGKIESLVISPGNVSTEIKDYINSEGFLVIPYEDVQAVGKYVIIDFPPE